MIETTVRFLLLVMGGAAGCTLATDLDQLGGGGATVAGSGGAVGTSAMTSSTVSGGGMASSYRELVLRANPVVYWRLGEALGDAVAVDEMGLHDADYIGVITQGAPGAIPGDDDTAVEFAAEGGRAIQLADTAALGFEGAVAMSLEVWIAPSFVDTTYRRIFSKEPAIDPSMADGYHVYLHGTEGLAWSRMENGTWESLQTELPRLNEYHHVVATFDGTTMSFYVDGELAGSRASTTVLVDTGAPFTLGALTNLYSGYSGRIDEVAVYDYALPGVVVLEHYVAGSN